MKEWEKELYIYRLDPTPPKKNLQEYISFYLAEKDEKYLSHFLHYYERTLNERVMEIVQDYAMYGHFADIKQVYVIGILKALQDYDISRGTPFVMYKEYNAMREVHQYIRTMRTGFTIQSDDEYLRLRKVMRLYAEYGNKCDDETINKIAQIKEINPKNVLEILQAGLRNTQFIDYFRKYPDEDDEESWEEVATDHTSEPDKLFFKIDRANKVMSAFENLNYRERAMISAHLGFCLDCYSSHYFDENDLDEYGNPKKKKHKSQSFVDIAIDHGLSSPDTADKTYRKALEKMKKELKDL